jgi:hypothetical protein
MKKESRNFMEYSREDHRTEQKEPKNRAIFSKESRKDHRAE